MNKKIINRFLNKHILTDVLPNFSLDIDVKDKNSSTYILEGGNLHDSYCLSLIDKNHKLKYVVQKLNPVFNFSAVNKNLRLFEKAQDKSIHKLPGYWQPVKYISVLGSTDKIYFDRKGIAWRIMEYIPGKIQIFENFNQVSKKYKNEIAYSLGESIAIFDGILKEISQNKWEKPLPDFHNTLYHYNYLYSIVNGKEVVLSLSSNKSNKVRLNKKFFVKYQDRINPLLSEIEKRKKLISCLDGVGFAAVHGDPKLNNAVFRRTPTHHWQCSTLIDLDTIQVGNILDDLGDALRSAGSSAGELPPSLNFVGIDKIIIKNLIAGYLSKIKYYYNATKISQIKKHIFMAYAKFLYELGIRFLADSLVENRYFHLGKNDSLDLNLYRAEVQLKTLETLRKTYGNF